MGFFKKLADGLRGYPDDIAFPNGIWRCVACNKHFPPRTRNEIYLSAHTTPNDPATLITQSGKGTCLECTPKYVHRAGTQSPQGETLYLLTMGQLWNLIEDPPAYYFQAEKDKAREFAESYTYQASNLVEAHNDMENALYGFKRATEIDPTYFMGWYTYMYTYQMRNEWEKVGNVCSDALKHFPTSGLFYVWRGAGTYIRAEGLKDYHKAIAMMQSALVDVTSGIQLGISPHLRKILEQGGMDPRLIELEWNQKQMMIRDGLGEAQYTRVMNQMRIQNLVANSNIERDIRNIKNQLNRL